MGMLFEGWLMNCFGILCASCVGIVSVLYFYFKVKYNYWKNRGVPCLEPTFPFGNLKDAFSLRKHVGEVFVDLYKQLDGHKFAGVFQLASPVLVLRDPELIKCCLIKDFAHFHDRGIHFDEKNDPINAHLFLLTGQKWRNLRKKLTPTFTSGKIKVMFETVLNCGQELKECVKEEASRGETIEIKDFIARYSTDVIASCVFGVLSNSLQDPNAAFRVKGKEVMSPTLLQVLGFLVITMVPSVTDYIKVGGVPQHLVDFFRNLVKDTIEYREKNDVIRPDFMQLMIQLKNRGYVDVDKDAVADDESVTEDNEDNLTKLTVDQIAAQAFMFFVAGFETSSSTASICLLELALNPDIQNRLRLEVDKVLAQHGGQITYDAVQEMEYLDRVMAETMRKYPSIGNLIRECTITYKIPDSDVVIEKGTQVVVPVLALHHDPQYFPEPQRFDPERFTKEEKAKRSNYVYFPFGEGPRICIGMRFGLIQTKVAVVSLLQSYEFSVSPKTQVPLIYDPKQFPLSPKDGVFLHIANRKN